MAGKIVKITKTKKTSTAATKACKAKKLKAPAKSAVCRKLASGEMTYMQFCADYRAKHPEFKHPEVKITEQGKILGKEWRDYQCKCTGKTA